MGESVKASPDAEPLRPAAEPRSAERADGSPSLDVAAMTAGPRMAAQRRTIDAIHQSPRVAAQARRVEALAQVQPAAGPGTTTTADVVQRTIWKAVTKRSLWQRARGKPGNVVWQVAERGTAGKHPLPNAPQAGDFFNDVTAATGPSADAVRAGLLDRMMHTGSLVELMKPADFKSLSKRLGKHCQTNGINELNLGTVRLKNDNGKVTGRTLTADLSDPRLGEAADFLLAFMRANGQLSYIEDQNWFKVLKAPVFVDVNYYHDREIGGAELGMHKDTAGDNLFVNLIFNNEKETPATEWMQDADDPLGEKRKAMTALLPQAMMQSIVDAKTELRQPGTHAGGRDQVEGGVMPAFAFVSWVDELIWHSSPAMEPRPKYDKEKTAEYLSARLDSDPSALEPGDAQVLHEAMVVLSEHAGTAMHSWWSTHALHYGGVLTLAVWEDVLESLHTDEGERSRDVVRQDIATFDWNSVKWSGRVGEETDSEPRTGLAKSRAPTSLGTRGRVNSDAAMNKRVNKAKARQPRRSFLRSWVRVSKPGDLLASSSVDSSGGGSGASHSSSAVEMPVKSDLVSESVSESESASGSGSSGV